MHRHMAIVPIILNSHSTIQFCRRPISGLSQMKSLQMEELGTPRHGLGQDTMGICDLKNIKFQDLFRHNLWEVKPRLAKIQSKLLLIASLNYSKSVQITTITHMYTESVSVFLQPIDFSCPHQEKLLRVHQGWSVYWLSHLGKQAKLNMYTLCTLALPPEVQHLEQKSANLFCEEPSSTYQGFMSQKISVTAAQSAAGAVKQPQVT